jgi:hypothetical protein
MLIPLAIARTVVVVQLDPLKLILATSPGSLPCPARRFHRQAQRRPGLRST